MNVSVLYLQANEQIARTIKGKFDEGQVEFLIVSTAKEAFNIYKERVITITLVDANIRDMKLGDFLTQCQKEYPNMILNVCTDVKEPANITMLTANPAVVKIFIPPWDVDTIVEGVEDSIDGARLNSDYRRRKEELEKEEAEFIATLDRLKASLIRQKYSYNRIEPLLNGTLNAFANQTSVGADDADFIKKICNKMLILETAMSLKCAQVGDAVKSCIGEIDENIEIVKIDSCLMGDVAKSVLADVITSIYMITLLENNRSDSLSISISSEFKTSQNVEFTIEYAGSFNDSNVDRKLKYVERILANIVDDYNYNVENDKHIWEINVQLH